MTTFYDSLKKKYRITLFFSVCLLIISIIFVSLFVHQKKINQQNYQKIFYATMANAASLVKQCSEDDYDYDTKYREITAEIDVCCQMAYLVDMSTERQKSLNRLYYGCIKLPNQIKLYISDLSAALGKIINNEEDSGYEQLLIIVDKFDELDYGVSSN